MAVFNEILSGRFARFAQKHFSMKGRAPTPTLAADVQVGLNYHSGEESRIHEGWDLFAFGFSIAATAAQTSNTTLRNPPNSNVLAVVTVANASAALADSYTLTMFPRGTAGALVDQPNVRIATGLDPRGRPSSSCVYSDSSGGAITAQGGGINMARIFLPAAGNLEFLPADLEIPILPGVALSIFNGTVNQANSNAIWWRERSLEESERT